MPIDVLTVDSSDLGAVVPSQAETSSQRVGPSQDTVLSLHSSLFVPSCLRVSFQKPALGPGGVSRMIACLLRPVGEASLSNFA